MARSRSSDGLARSALLSPPRRNAGPACPFSGMAGQLMLPLNREGCVVMKTAAAIITLLAWLAGIAVAHAETVDLLLVLAADVSRSIDETEFNLQRRGYAAAITDPRVLRAIVGGRNHAIAVTFIEWSGAADQNVVVDWTVVRDEEAAGSVAATMLAAPRSFLGRTTISAVIDFSLERIAA